VLRQEQRYEQRLQKQVQRWEQREVGANEDTGTEEGAEEETEEGAETGAEEDADTETLRQVLRKQPRNPWNGNRISSVHTQQSNGDRNPNTYSRMHSAIQARNQHELAQLFNRYSNMNRNNSTKKPAETYAAIQPTGQRDRNDNSTKEPTGMRTAIQPRNQYYKQDAPQFNPETNTSRNSTSIETGI
jgi:hypothetical protein